MDTVTHDAPATEWGSFKRRVVFAPRSAVLDLAVRLAHPIAGNIVEFGVADGTSTHVLRRSLSRCEGGRLKGARKRIFACDSFKGLPEKFETLQPGEFACDPPRIRGVEIVEGYFQDSLTPELARRVCSVSLASLDADLYSSTRCALRWLTPLLHTGSLLLFDEFLGEGESEKRAFEEWSQETGIRTLAIAEFLRDPSGWGTHLDKRVLVQVVGTEELRPRPFVSIGTTISALRVRLGIRTRLKRLIGTATGPRRG